MSPGDPWTDPQCAQNGESFISSLTTSTVPCALGSVSLNYPKFPEQAALSSQDLAHAAFSPSSTCWHSQLLVGTQSRVTSFRKPSRPHECQLLPAVLYGTARFWNCSHPPCTREASAGWGAVSRCRGAVTGEVLAVVGWPLSGVGGRDHGVKAGCLHPRDPVVARIWFSLGFRLF